MFENIYKRIILLTMVRILKLLCHVVIMVVRNQLVLGPNICRFMQKNVKICFEKLGFLTYLEIMKN